MRRPVSPKSAGEGGERTVWQLAPTIHWFLDVWQTQLKSGTASLVSCCAQTAQTAQISNAAFAKTNFKQEKKRKKMGGRRICGVFVWIKSRSMNDFVRKEQMHDNLVILVQVKDL